MKSNPIANIPEADRWRGGKPARRWSYTYRDLAALFGVAVGTIRDWVSERKLDPSDLRKVFDLLRARADTRRGQMSAHAKLCAPHAKKD